MQRPVKIFLPFLSRSKSCVHRYYKETRPSANVNHLVSRLRVKINDERRKLSQPEGPEGRLKMLRYTVTALFKYERIEGSYNRVHEAQGYTERLISEAIRHGDCHIATMEMADYWLLEKQLIHKLFKVLVPRYEQSTRSYTRLYTAPRRYYGDGYYTPRKDSHIDPEFAWTVHRPKAVIELRGNPYPPLLIPQISNARSLHNVLLWAAREEKRKSEVEETLREEGLLGKSAHLQNLLERSSARLQKRDILGEEQNQLDQNVTEASAENIDVRESRQDLSQISVEDSVKDDMRSDSKQEVSNQPNKTS